MTSTLEAGATDLENLVERWGDSTDAGFKEAVKRYYNYVLHYIIPVISENAELAGFPLFGNVRYTQNVSESGNAMLKNKTEFKESDVDSFILELKELVTREDEVARALVGLDPPYEVLKAFDPFVSKSADHLINPELSEQERKNRKTKLLNTDFSVVLSKVDEFQPLGINDAWSYGLFTNVFSYGIQGSI